jgi:hypothetical protein
MKWNEPAYHPGHSGYVSEFEQFLNSFRAGHPNMERDQQRGWYIWWDHRVDLAELERERKDSVPLPPYSYE